MNYKKMTDPDLLQLFQGGDERSFEELIARYSPKAFSLCCRLTKNQQDAEEALQDVFVTVFRKIKGFEGKSSFSSWLYRITVNSSLMKLRKRRQEQSIPMDDVLLQIKNTASNEPAHQIEGEASSLRGEVASVLERAVTALPDEYRPVFVLRDIDGLTSREVSKILGISVPAVKSRLHRSRLMLRKSLEGFYQEYDSSSESVRVDPEIAEKKSNPREMKAPIQIPVNIVTAEKMASNS